MPTIFGFGNTLISDRKLRSLSEGQLEALIQNDDEVHAGEAWPIAPIGLGRPLSIEIAYIYTGNLTRPGFFPNRPDMLRPDMLVTSAVKSVPGEGLKNKSDGKIYDGPDPYVVMLLDGTEREDYTAFASTMATAAMLEKYLHAGQQQSTPTDLLLQSMKTVNDVYFLAKSNEMKKKLENMVPGSGEANNAKLLFDAYVKNIADENLRPTS